MKTRCRSFDFVRVFIVNILSKSHRGAMSKKVLAFRRASATDSTRLWSTQVGAQNKPAKRSRFGLTFFLRASTSPLVSCPIQTGPKSANIRLVAAVIKISSDSYACLAPRARQCGGPKSEANSSESRQNCLRNSSSFPAVLNPIVEFLNFRISGIFHDFVGPTTSTQTSDLRSSITRPR